MVKEAKRFDDVMPKIEFHPELPKLSLKEIVDVEYLIKEAVIIKDFDSQFGTSDFALIMLTDLTDGKEYTTLCGGMVVVKKIQLALTGNLLPLKATISYNGTYYDIK